MTEKKLSSGGSFGGKKPAKPAPQRPAPARPLNQEKQKTVEQRRAELRAKQEELRAKRQASKPSVPPAAIAGAATAAAGAAAAGAAALKANPGESLRERLNSCQSDFDNLQDDILLSSVHDDMGQVEAVLATLATDLEQYRAQGYVFRSFLENKINVLTDKWEALCDEIDDDVRKQGDSLTREAEATSRVLQQAIGGNTTLLSRAESAVKTLEQKAEAARNALQGRYRDVATTIRQTRDQLDDVEWALAQVSEAKFDFLQAEYVVSACKARLLEKADAGDGPEGILFLTDERLIFEQKEQVATKKFLFITTASETVQQTLLAEPLDHLAKLDTQDVSKFFASKELLQIGFSSEARTPYAIIELLDGASNESWGQMINRVKTGEIDRERIAAAAEEKEEVSAQVAEAPTVCSTCGASLSVTITRGQDILKCDYCGAVTRLKG